MKNSSVRRTITATFLSLACMAAQAVWAVPQGFNIQGRLTDSNGINKDGIFAVKFTVFDSYTAGNPLWSRTYSSVNIKNGNFQVTLEDPDDSGRKLVDSINAAAPSLEIQVVGGPGLSGPEPALAPRQRLLSVPFALKAKTVEEGIPTGVIVMWSGAVTNIPVGWVLCDGANNTPDLRERFIVGAGGDNPEVPGAGYAKGAVGGEKEHILSIPEMPSHTHDYLFNSVTKVGGGGYGYYTYNPYNLATTPAGGNQAHENRPPYYALAFIMKL